MPRLFISLRDLEAFAKEKIGPNGEAGTIGVIASRDDAELADFEINAELMR